MALILDSVVLEITRRCNMACDHCLRGDAQAKDIDFRVIDALLDQAGDIWSITFTGGEPTLNVPALRYFVGALKSRGRKIGSFYIVTNGKIVPPEFLHVILDLYSLSDSGSFEDGIGGLCISKDQYHEGPSEEAIIYEAFKFFEERSDTSDDNLINEGRARDNGLGSRDIEQEKWEIDILDDDVIVRNNVYISYDGRILTSCDMSYDRIDSEAQGNIFDGGLLSLVDKSAATVPQI